MVVTPWCDKLYSIHHFMKKADLLDRKILKVISVDARRSFKEIAAQCGVSRAAIHQRVVRMVRPEGAKRKQAVEESLVIPMEEVLQAKRILKF